VTALLLDVEGTLYASGSPLPGAAEAVARLRSAGVAMQFLSNTDSAAGRTLAAKLCDMGIEVGADEVTTPIDALRLELEREGARCHLLVSSEAEEELRPWASEPPVDVVVVGDARERLSYERLDEAFRLVAEGARLVALQRGRFFLRGDGPHLDTGAIVAALEYAAGARAELVGKPSPAFFRAALERMGAAGSNGQVVVVGDDADTDVAGGAALGARTVLVRTGKQARRSEDGLDPAPDRVLDSVAALPDLLERW
jgi:HAD superfamily hydrolase (TIGR01458 family)